MRDALRNLQSLGLPRRGGEPVPARRCLPAICALALAGVALILPGTLAAQAMPSYNCTSTVGPTTVGVLYTDTCTASGGTPPYHLDTQGTIPAGLTYTQTNATTFVLSGTPTTAGPYSYAIGVTDSANQGNGIQFTGTLVAGVAPTFQVSSLPVQVRGEGTSETVGAVVLQATGSGTINAGSSILLIYPAAITNLSGPGSIHAVLTSSPPTTAGNFAVSAVGNQITLTASAGANFAPGDYLEVHEVRLNINPLGTNTVAASVAGNSGISFTQTTVPVASVVSPSITASLVQAAPTVQTCSVGASQPFSLKVGEKFPAAFTTHADENSFTPDFPSSNGTVLNVTLNNVPAGLAITANTPTPLGSTVVGLSLSTPSSVTSTGAPITFSYNIINDSTSVSESVQLNFNLSLPGGVAGSIPSLAATANITASVTLGPLTGSGLTPAFASVPESAGTVATVTNCAGSPLTFTCNPTAGPTTVGAAYSSVCTAAGGTAPYSFVLPTNGVSGNSVPLGLSFTTTTTTVNIGGAATAPGAYSFAIPVTDSETPPKTVTATFAGAITAAASLSFKCNPTTGPTAVGTAYSTTCTAAGGTAPYSFDSNGTIPVGLNQTKTATTVTLSGTPTAAGSYSYALGVSDSSTPAQSTGTSFTGTITAAAAPLTFTCNPTTGPTAVGAAYSTTCTAAGGTAPYSFDTNGTIPAGLTLTKTATTVTLSGTPTAPVSYSYALGVSDSSTPAQSTGTTFTGTIAAFAPLSYPCTLAPTAFPTTAGVAYNFTCTPTGGVLPYMVTITGGVSSANANETFTAPYTTAFSGTTTAGPYSLVLNVMDSETPPKSVTTTFAGTIAAAGGPFSITCSPAPTTISMTVGVPYTITCTAAGGTAPYAPSANGVVPAGLTVTTTATTAKLSGTPTATGQYNLLLGAQDSGTPTQNATVHLTGTIAPAGTPTSSSGGFVSAATFQGGANATGLVTPGGLYSAFGSNLGPAQYISNTAFGADGKLPTTLGSAMITFDGIPAPLTLSDSGQLNFQAPFELAGKTSTQVVITYSGSQSVAITVPVGVEQPTFFTVTPEGQDSIGINLDYTLNTAQNPAARGSVVTFYGTGFGVPSYTIVTGAPSPDPPPGYTGNYTCTVGTLMVNAQYAGYSPTVVGLVQFNVPIPANAPTGASPVVCTSPAGTSTQQGTVYIK